MKKRDLIRSVVSLGLILSLFCTLELRAQVTCDCKEYIYLNEPFAEAVLKFEVTTSANFPLPALTGANGGPYWYPGTITPSELPSPHGLATDLNGNLYIGDVNRGANIRKFNCDGVIEPIDANTIVNEEPNGDDRAGQNFFSIDNTLYINTDGGPTAYDLCTGDEIGQACLDGAPSSGSVNARNLWGLSYNATTEMVYATQRRGQSKVWAFTRAQLEASVADASGNTCIDPLIIESSSEDVDDIDVGDMFLPSKTTDYFGIVGDNDRNFYVVHSSRGSGTASPDVILKYDENGGFLAKSIEGSNATDSDPLNNFFSTLGIVWSEQTNTLFVANFTDDPDVDCITAFNAADMSSLGTAAPNPGLPTDDSGKALNILVECCPTNLPTNIERTVCGAIGTTYFLNEEAFAACDGIVCSSNWAEVSLNGATFEPCNNSVTITGEGCSEFTLNLTAVTSTNCPAQSSTFTICNTFSSSADAGTTEATCNSTTPNNDAQINLTNVVGDVVGISSPGATMYDGSSYDITTAAADLEPVSGMTADFTGLMPGTTYFVRVFSGGDDCVTDIEVMTPVADCSTNPCPVQICSDLIIDGVTVAAESPTCPGPNFFNFGDPAWNGNTGWFDIDENRTNTSCSAFPSSLQCNDEDPDPDMDLITQTIADISNTGVGVTVTVAGNRDRNSPEFIASGAGIVQVPGPNLYDDNPDGCTDALRVTTGEEITFTTITFTEAVPLCQFFTGGNNWRGFGARKNVSRLTAFDGPNGTGNPVLPNFSNPADGISVDPNNWNIATLNTTTGEIFSDVADDGSGGSRPSDERGYTFYDYNGALVRSIVFQSFGINPTTGEFVPSAVSQWIGACAPFNATDCNIATRTVCDDGSNSITLEAPSIYTNIVWFDGDGIQVGTGSTLDVDANTQGLGDGSEEYGFTGLDANGCLVELCCPVLVNTEVCTPMDDCTCTDYIYLNDEDLDLTHKFRINNTSGMLEEIGNPWLPNINAPHGLAQDLNGRVYIKEIVTGMGGFFDGFQGPIFQIDCDGGMAIDENFFDYTFDASGGVAGGSNFNFASSDGIFYGPDGFSDAIQAYDLCDGDFIGSVDIPGIDNVLIWGFTIHEGNWYAAERNTGNIYTGSVDTSGFTDPIATTGASVFLSTGVTPADPFDDLGLMGITFDDDDNLYVVLNNLGGDVATTEIRKYEPGSTTPDITITDANNNSGVGFDDPGMAGFWGARGISYSPLNNQIYVGNFVNCVTVFDTDLMEISSLNIPNPSDGLPKGISIVTECCPNVDLDLSESVCFRGETETFFLNQIFSCGPGVVCEGTWEEVEDLQDIFEFNDCDFSIEVSDIGCATYRLFKDNDATGNQQCDAFDITVEICANGADAEFATTPSTCDGPTEQNNGIITLTSISGTGTSFGISSPIASGDPLIYDGPMTEAAADPIPAANTDIITDAPHAGATYIVRFFAGADDCFTDFEVVVPAGVSCGNVNDCDVSIDRVSVSECFFDEDSGQSLAVVDIEVSWQNPPGPAFTSDVAGPRRDSIAVMANGETKFVYLEAPFLNRGQGIQGYYELSSPQLIKFTVPADGMTGQSIAANFTSDLTCQDDATYDRPDPCPTDPCVAGSNTVGGTVFEDINLNGTRDGGEPLGIDGIEVSIYVCDANGNSVLIGTTTTDVDGNYYFDASNTSPAVEDGEDYRVEFTLPMNSVFEPTCGQQNGYTTVQFGSSPTCDIDLGLADPSTSCEENPDIVTTCYVGGSFSGSGAQNFGTILSYPFDAPDGNFGSNAGNNAGPSNTYYGYHNQTGAVWGLAYRPSDSLMFSSAVLRRQSGYGPLGSAGVYVTDFSQAPGTNGSNAPTQNFLDLSFSGTFDFGGTPARTDLANTPTGTPNRDSEALPLVATIGLGDLEISADGNTLYTVNLFDKQLYQIDISGYDGTNATLPTVADVTVDPLPNPCGGTGEVRPWALKERGDDLFVGFVCDASITDAREDMRAYVYIFNTVTGTFNPTPVFDFPLNYPRGAGTLDAGLWDRNVWEPWSNDWDGTIADENDWYFIVDGQVAGQPRIIYDYPQPILADIEIDVDNTLILVFNDRTSLQVGNIELAPSGSPNNSSTFPNSSTFMGHTAAGDILRAFSPDGVTYILESEAISGGLTGAGPGNFQGPGYGEFFDDNFFSEADGTGQLVHSELVVGGAAIAPGSGLTVVATADPTNGTNFANGTRTYDNSTGQFVSSYTVYTSASQPNAATFGKTAGLGDVELLCNVFDKLEIGNYVWQDDNGDGIQDPCEPPLEGVVVELYADDGTLLASTTTGSNGEYYFSEDGAPDQNWETTDDGLMPNSDYIIAFGNTQFDPTDGLDLGTGVMYMVTMDMTGQSPRNDLNDSDPDPDNLSTAMGDLPADLPFTSVTTPTSGVDHSFDAGFTPFDPATVSLGSTVFEDPDNNGIQDTGEDGIEGVLVLLFIDGGDGLNDGADDSAVLTGADGIFGTADDGWGPDGIMGNADDGQPGRFTDSEGDYFFGDLMEGDYYVQIPATQFDTDAALEDIPLSSNTSSGTFAGETDPDDDNLDGDDEGVQMGSGTATTSNIITLAAGTEPTDSDTETAQGNDQDNPANGFVDEDGNMTLDFGFFAPVTVGDYTFVDINENGLQEDPFNAMDESPLAGVEVTIIDVATGMPVAFDAEGATYTATQTTMADGSYLFENLPPGNYFVQFDLTNTPNEDLYVYTTPNAGDDAADSDATPSNPGDRVASSGETGFLSSGEEDLTLDAGVVCNVLVSLPDPGTICGTDVIDLSTATISPTSVGGTWSTPDGDNSNFVGGTTFGATTGYDPSEADAARGSVTLILTTEDPNGPCTPESAQVTFIVLKVDCGTFPWEGTSGSSVSPGNSGSSQ